jgi:hypothetical protein
MSMSAVPHIEKMEVGEIVKMAGVFLGVSKDEPVISVLVEKGEGEAVFELSYFGIPLGTLFAVRNGQSWSWEY